MKISDLANRKIAILGAGREGLAVRSWLRQQLPELAVTMVAETEPDSGVRQNLAAGDHLVVEPLTAARLGEFDVLVRSPGISVYREPLVEARNSGVKITSASSLWFAAHPDARTICVTGTKGKSTTSALISHLLQANGYSVQLAGNIGRPLFSCGDENIDFWIIELSSYQIADLEASPDMALILNISPEHLDWHGNETNYMRDKLRLADLVGEGVCMANAADPDLVRLLGSRANLQWFNTPDGYQVRKDGVYWQEQRLVMDVPVSMPGKHNLANLAAALTVCSRLGMDRQRACDAIASFKSLPHRLQVIGQRTGVTFINDSISSTPLSTVAALEALAGKPVVLLAGGLDRGLDWSRYLGDFREHLPKAVIGMPDSGPRILDLLQQNGIHPAGGTHAAQSLADAVKQAMSLCQSGDVLLLSPGAPSFPRFRDYQHRGKQFAELCGFALAD